MKTDKADFVMDEFEIYFVVIQKGNLFLNLEGSKMKITLYLIMTLNIRELN